MSSFACGALLQAKLFPLYFQLSCAAIALMIGTLSQGAVGLAHSQVTALGAPPPLYPGSLMKLMIYAE